jgi:hypothetical protein
MPSFAAGEFELRRFPAFRRRLEAALGCRVQAMTRGEWEWTLAFRDLAPWTDAARAYAAANDAWFDQAFEEHVEWMEAVGRAERRRRVARVRGNAM